MSYSLCSKNMKSMRKHAPKRAALIFTSKSKGKLIPKLSASVKASFTRPVHCLEIRPTCVDSSMDSTSKFTSEQHLQEQHGPTIFRTASRFSFCMVNLGMKGCQFWITYPIGLPGGDWISSSCRQQGQQQLPHLKGRVSVMTSCPLLS